LNSIRDIAKKLLLGRLMPISIFKSFSAMCLVAVLTGCGTSEIVRNPNNTFSSSAQYGSLNGSWARAQAEAMAKANEFCSRMGQTYYFVDEKRDGVLGWSPQQSTITFACGQSADAYKDVQLECEKSIQVQDLDSIRTKIQLTRLATDEAVPFDIATNDKFPNAVEVEAIRKWANLREQCIAKIYRVSEREPTYGSALQRSYADQIKAFQAQLAASVSDLIVALYQQKMTYGEFAQKRYEISKNITTAERDFRRATLLADRDIQIKQAEIAQQQVQSSLISWSAYMAAVNARQPQTIRLQSNCLTTRYGTSSSTNCF
jgi:hypothetical protein